MKTRPQGVMSTACSMLKETFGTEKKCAAYNREKPMCDTGKSGRYLEQSGRYFAAQQPSTILDDHGRAGDGTL